MPGVLLILTGASPEVLALGMESPSVARSRRDGSPAFVGRQPYLASDYVRYVGEPLAFIVAATIEQARDAAEELAVDYAPLPAVTSACAAVERGAPTVWNGCRDNEAFFHEAGNGEAAARVFASAPHVIRHQMTISRLAVGTIEPRSCVATYRAAAGSFTLRCPTQAPHGLRRGLARQVLKVPEEKIRVVSGDVGGSFGMKAGLYPEYVLSLLAARLLNRPVKWIATRTESMLCDRQGRDNLTEAELAVSDTGQFLGLRVRTLVNLGAYNGSDLSARSATANLGVLAGTYRLPAIHVQVSGVLSHTVPTGPYRGAGRPEAAYVIETMIDVAARTLRIDPAELRRRNTITASAMPFKTALGHTYDCGDFLRTLHLCLDAAEYGAFAGRRRASEAHGKLRGIGISNTVEMTNPFRIPEHATIQFTPDGDVTLSVGTHDHGQGHGTTYGQIAAEILGVTPDRIRFVCGDTDRVADGAGTFGSRSAVAGGTAVVLAAQKILATARRLAAHFMESPAHGITFEKGIFLSGDTGRSMALVDIGRRAWLAEAMPAGLSLGLHEAATYAGGTATFPNGCHVCEVEVDRETGAVHVVRYTAVDDVGRVINPLIVAGQIHGGVVQGLGQAFTEALRYDAQTGQPLSGSFLDYGLPRADDVCSFDVRKIEIPTKTNPLGAKGTGETGVVGALPAAMNAVNDALFSAGADYVDMPVTAEKIWRALRRASDARDRVRQSAAEFVS